MHTTVLEFKGEPVKRCSPSRQLRNLGDSDFQKELAAAALLAMTGTDALRGRDARLHAEFEKAKSDKRMLGATVRKWQVEVTRHS